MDFLNKANDVPHNSQDVRYKSMVSFTNPWISRFCFAKVFDLAAKTIGSFLATAPKAFF